MKLCQLKQKQKKHGIWNDCTVGRCLSCTQPTRVQSRHPICFPKRAKNNFLTQSGVTGSLGVAPKSKTKKEKKKNPSVLPVIYDCNQYHKDRWAHMTLFWRLLTFPDHGHAGWPVSVSVMTWPDSGTVTWTSPMLPQQSKHVTDHKSRLVSKLHPHSPISSIAESKRIFGIDSHRLPVGLYGHST